MTREGANRVKPSLLITIGWWVFAAIMMETPISRTLNHEPSAIRMLLGWIAGVGAVTLAIVKTRQHVLSKRALRQG